MDTGSRNRPVSGENSSDDFLPKSATQGMFTLATLVRRDHALEQDFLQGAVILCRYNLLQIPRIFSPKPYKPCKSMG